MLREAGSAVAKFATFAVMSALLVLVIFDGSEVVLTRLDPRIEKWVADQMGAPDLTVGAVSFSLGAGDDPAGLTIHDIEIGGSDTRPAITLPRLETGFTVLDGVRGQLLPRTIRLGGAQITLVRNAANHLSVTANGDLATAVPLVGQGEATAALDPAEVLAALAETDDDTMLAEVTSVDLDDLNFSFLDQRADRVWRANGATGTARRDDDGMSASLNATLISDTGGVTPVQASFARSAATGVSRISVRFTDARPADIAAEVEALSWLRLIDAPVNGSLAAVFDRDGALTSLTGHLSLGAGEVVAGPERRIGFYGASSYFSYDPEAETFTVDSLEFNSGYGSATAVGQVELGRDPARRPTSLTGQMELSTIKVVAPDFLRREVAFESGRVAARVTFDPFRIDIGQAELDHGAHRLTLDGTVRALPTHWDAAINLATGALDLEAALDLWPPQIRPGMRSWIESHVHEGRFTRFNAFLRQSASDRNIGLDFAFADGAFQPLKTMPWVVGASGTAQLVGDRFDLVLDAGRSAPGVAQGIDLAGSRFSVLDTRRKPAVADIRIQGTGPIASMLNVIDRKPLHFLTRAGQGTDLATGTATTVAELRLPLIKAIPVETVEAKVAATLMDVQSDRLVPERVIEAETLELSATPEMLSIAGDITLSGVPMSVAFTRPMGPEATGRAEVRGTMAVTPQTVAGLGIPLPDGALRGAGSGRFTLDLAPDRPPVYTAAIGLAGAEVTIPGLGWRKRPDAGGRLSLEGRLGAAPTVDRFALDGPGLSATGRLDLGRGSVRRAELSRLAFGTLVDAPVTWEPRAGGADLLTVNGGTIDLRNGVTVGDKNAGAVEITLAPERVRITNEIALTGLRGNLSTGGGTRGRFVARLNGGPRVEGVIQPGGQVYATAEDGGAALAAAGIFRNARGGTLRVSLKPVEGGIDGGFSLKETRVVGAPVLAEILNVASIVGIADRLSGPGIGFDDVQGRFALDGDRIVIRNARAIGASLGVTLDGIYDTSRERLRMEGVVSPLYAVNGLAERIPIFGRLLGGRPGEGLLGATFRLTGSAASPGVSVNPLSILTPGATREIFQSRAAADPGR